MQFLLLEVVRYGGVGSFFVCFLGFIQRLAEGLSRVRYFIIVCVRVLESWGGGGTLRFRQSIVSLFLSLFREGFRRLIMKGSVVLICIRV